MANAFSVGLDRMTQPALPRPVRVHPRRPRRADGLPRSTSGWAQVGRRTFPWTEACWAWARRLISAFWRVSWACSATTHRRLGRCTGLELSAADFTGPHCTRRGGSGASSVAPPLRRSPRRRPWACRGLPV